jgi:hypothetical protein
MRHCRMTYSVYLQGIADQLARHRVLFVGETDHLQRDFIRMLQQFGLVAVDANNGCTIDPIDPSTLRAEHVTAPSVKALALDTVSGAARCALRQFLAADYAVLDTLYRNGLLRQNYSGSAATIKCSADLSLEIKDNSSSPLYLMQRVASYLSDFPCFTGFKGCPWVYYKRRVADHDAVRGHVRMEGWMDG